MTIDIVFETHSISVDNERAIASGWIDTPLSARGRELARELGERRRNDGIETVYASDLRRAQETASIAFEGSAVPILIDRRLRECDYGDLNGAPVEALAPRTRFIDRPFPNGESYRMVVERVGSFLGDMAHRDGARVLLIGHSATRWSLEVLLNGAVLEELVESTNAWQPGWVYRYSP